MSAPNPCPECSGSGWVMYTVETVEGEEEWAWKLCPECVGGDAFPPKEGEVEGRERRERPEVLLNNYALERCARHAYSNRDCNRHPLTKPSIR